ncbi:MAG: hypothetical protein VR65_19575 [Desulfobulbaceae bacterium BRH_c16a]|nr:MAG: hypothetical protein VR65_19575 [Desulfobulbaceae bacterium BRH_c16a]
MQSNGLHNWIEKFLFARTRSIKPDGRPLYAYKCGCADYETLKSIVLSALNTSLWNWPAPSEARFCLFAAETWRRCHSGGPWKWETVFRELEYYVPEHSWLSKTVENGLRWWRRPLLKNRVGHREFLVTIACEGGLPLLLLQKENVHLYRYFRQLLTAYHLERKSLSCDARQLAQRLSSIIPQSLRHDIVFSLSGDLIQNIVDLQEQVADAPDPISALDQKVGDWRNLLPLPLEDDTIERLLRNLVNEARTLSITERQKIRWRRFLILKGEEWSIEQVLDLPDRVSGSSLQAWLNSTNIPSRLRIFLYTSKGPEQIALLTRLKGEGSNAVFRCEVLRRQGVKLSGAEILDGVRLRISDGIKDHHLSIEGDQEWGPLPWSFRTGEEDMEFLGEGTIKSKVPKIFVLAPPDGSFEGDGSFEPVGLSLGTDRMLFEITGKGEWRHPELGICRYQCASAEESTETFLLDGPRIMMQLEENSPFQGAPKLFVINNNGNRHRIDNARLEWRPAGLSGLEWQKDIDECMGEVWIRYCDDEGSQFLLRKVRVVPPSIRISIEKIGIKQNEAGSIRIVGLGLCKVWCENIPGCHFEAQPISDGVDILSFSTHGSSITQFSCSISWSGGRSLILQLPFPRQGAAFVIGGNSIPPGGKIAASRLAAVHAIIQAPVGEKYFHLTAEIKSRNAAYYSFSLNESIYLDGRGRGQFDLHRIQEKLSSMLALTGDLDAVAELKILDIMERSLAAMEVGLFELVFIPDYASNLLTLPINCIEQLEKSWEQQLNIKMIKLWQPEAEPLLLKRSGASVAWTVPEELEAGPWLVLGEEGDWPRFRPVLWRIDGELEPSTSLLVQTICEQDRLTRQNKFHEFVQQLGQNPDHPDWTFFSDYLQLTRRYPASAFDLFRYLIKEPEALVLGLLRSDDKDFDAIWSLAYQLPFSWHLVPVAIWESAASRFIFSLRGALSSLEEGEEMVWQTFQTIRERVSIRQPFFRQICDWLSLSLFPGRQLENSELCLAKQAPQIIFDLIVTEEQKLQARHNANEHYPDGPLVMECLHHSDYNSEFSYKRLARPYRPVRCAPFVAAQIAIAGESYGESVLFELQKLRNFDREWFDSAFAFALCLGLVKLSEIPMGVSV